MLNKYFYYFISALTVVSFCLPSQADKATVYVGEPFSTGNCRVVKQEKNTVSTVAILLEDFIAENGRRATCHVRIPVSVPDGYFLQDMNITYQGFKDVKDGGTAFLKSIYSVGADTVRGVNANFRPGTDIYTVNAPFPIAGFSRCGFDSIIGINMTAYASRGSMITLDSGNFEAGKLMLDFKLLPCKSQEQKKFE